MQILLAMFVVEIIIFGRITYRYLTIIVCCSEKYVNLEIVRKKVDNILRDICG